MIWQKTANKSTTRVICYMAVFVALLVVLSQIAIPVPFLPVPFSLGLLAVLLTGCLLGSTLGSLTVLIYILLGVMGLPVFVGFNSVGAVLGATGGYIIGYIPTAFVAGIFAKKGRNMMIVGLILAVLVCTLFGAVGMAVNLNIDFGGAMLTALAFVPLDLVKVVLAALVALRLKKIRNI